MRTSDPSGESHRGPFAIRKILVPLDFSEYSRKALQYALPFAQQFKAKLLLVCVVEPRVYPVDTLVVPPAMEDDTTDAVQGARAAMHNLIQTLALPPELLDEPFVVVGRPYAEIVDTAKRVGADMIIMATHGYTGLKHVYLGSVTERVVRHAPCPVLVVREHEREFVELPKVA
jgi:universal stress protein A